jgi:hypothetical protein
MENNINELLDENTLKKVYQDTVYPFNVYRYMYAKYPGVYGYFYYDYLDKEIIDIEKMLNIIKSIKGTKIKTLYNLCLKYNKNHKKPSNYHSYDIVKYNNIFNISYIGKIKRFYSNYILDINDVANFPSTLESSVNGDQNINGINLLEINEILSPLHNDDSTEINGIKMLFDGWSFIEVEIEDCQVGFIFNGTLSGVYRIDDLRSQELAYTIIEEMHKLKDDYDKLNKQKKSKINFITQTTQGMNLQEVDFFLKNPIKDLSLYYNDNFISIDAQIKKLVDNKDKGFVLLHGKPGTGKSNYIEYITKYCIDKEVNCVYLPNSCLSILSSPNFISFALEQLKNCVLIIEDAEEILLNRDVNRNSAVSNLLNLTDGLLSSTIQCKVIATFNTKLKNIDPALLRNGRLTILYEFDELSIDKTNNLRKSLGLEEGVKKEVLADIFNNATIEKNVKEGVKIGF